MPLTSTFVEQPQPDSPMYPISSLYGYRVFDRASYLQAFGEQAPRFDPAKPVKSWFATDGKTHFTAFDSNKKQTVDVTLTAAEAASVNLLGAFTYPKYTPPSNVATFNFFGTSITINDPTRFVRQQDAEAIAKEVGGTVKEHAADNANSFPFTYANQDSKIYDVVLPSGKVLDCANLIAQRFQAGRGAPGKWSADFVKFTPDVQVTEPPPGAPPEIPIPIRALLPNEEIVSGLFGAVVARKDKKIVSPGGGSFTDEDRKTLQEVHAMLQGLITALRLGPQ